MILPALRPDVAITVYEEGGEQYLVLHDPFGIGEGPIMLHADMFDVLAACDGETRLIDLARSADVEPDGPEIRRVELFVRQLQELGFLEGEGARHRQHGIEQEWLATASRPMVCAGATYPADPEAFRQFCCDELGIFPADHSGGAAQPLDGDMVPSIVLAPHIDFRVAPYAYREAFSVIGRSDATLVVMIGTSHYWSDHPVIASTKPYATPLGLLPVIDHDLGIPEADLAHKPEHSLELHAVLLRHLWPDRDVAILPILVTSRIAEPGVAEEWSQRILQTVEASGRKPIWLISGDLAHFGRKFGGDVPAAALLDEARNADAELLSHLQGAHLQSYRTAIERDGNPWNVCGYAPTVLALTCKNPREGTVLRYDMWNEEETQSAVSFASIVWQ